MSKILVVFYSFSNTTKRLAEEIAEQTKGDIRELIPEKSYAFNYNTATKEVRNEIERGYCPKLVSGVESVESYDYIFLGTPNWFKSFAPPILSFLRNVDLQGKTIIPFCTHGGGGLGQIQVNIEEECPKSTVLSGFETMSNFDKEKIKNWLKKISL
ncbi:flavodoxin [Clostridium paridis]|uniref:Flavodoxin n=1 Tax=Clostridium paridis TaxID=2803863 RepID=A0A937K4R9_9CLOT|nr:flavodoxin [Clostridium paridis]MBL4931813.1 flavodoxin [Clostridium paridis]